MNATATNRMLAYKRRMNILELLETKKMTPMEVSQYISESLSIIKADLKRLYLSRYLKRERKFDPSCSRNVYAYSTKNKNLPCPNVVINEKQNEIIENADFLGNFNRDAKKNDLPIQKIGHAKVIVDPNNSNKTTYLNLGRDGKDYAWQRKKHKTTIGIGSSFALYDGATL